VLLSRVFDIVAPDSAPQVYIPSLGGVAHPLAPEVMQVMRERGPAPIALWKLVNSLSDARRPDSRARRRCWRLRYWGACRELRKAGLLYRHRGLISTRDFGSKPKPKTAKSLSTSVAKTVCQTAGSNAVVTVTEKGMGQGQLIQNELSSSSDGMMAAPLKSENAKSTAEQIGAAASLLAMRPRPRKRKWTGVLRGERLRRRTPVEVPNGDVLAAFAIRRGKVFVFAPEGSGRFFDRYDASEVRRIKNPAAVVMGRQKRGVREQPSSLKAASARRNGCSPCREGRKRGRPPNGRQASTASKRA
jgi:hypothetical protein